MLLDHEESIHLEGEPWSWETLSEEDAQWIRERRGPAEEATNHMKAAEEEGSDLSDDSDSLDEAEGSQLEADDQSIDLEAPD